MIVESESLFWDEEQAVKELSRMLYESTMSKMVRITYTWFGEGNSQSQNARNREM